MKRYKIQMRNFTEHGNKPDSLVESIIPKIRNNVTRSAILVGATILISKKYKFLKTIYKIWFKGITSPSGSFNY